MRLASRLFGCLSYSRILCHTDSKDLLQSQELVYSQDNSLSLSLTRINRVSIRPLLKLPIHRVPTGCSAVYSFFSLRAQRLSHHCWPFLRRLHKLLTPITLTFPLLRVWIVKENTTLPLDLLDNTRPPVLSPSPLLCLTP